MSAAKKNVAIEAPVEAVVETPATTVPADLFIEIPAKICVQIGQRKRYFDTREAALAALNDFNTKGAGKPKGASRTFLTAEQKAEKAARREVLMTFAAIQGKEGKNQAALANVVEDIVAEIPALLALIEEYNATPKVAEPVQIGSPEHAAVIEADPLADPLADFM